MVGLFFDVAAMAAGVLIARYLMHLSTPAKDWHEVQHVYWHVSESFKARFPKIRPALFSVLHIDRLLQLRMKLYFAGGNYADDR